MTTTKKNKIFLALPILLLLGLISTAMISGTFARYASEYAGQDTALVARWSFTGEFNDAELSGTDMILPIWDHTYATNLYTPAGDNDLIAPGVQGAFKIAFSYDADVDADLTFRLTKSGTAPYNAHEQVPLQFSLVPDFDDTDKLFYDIGALQDAIMATASTTSTATITGSAGTYVVTNTAEASGADPAGPISVEQTIYWRWPYDEAMHNDASIYAKRVAGDAAFPGTGAELSPSPLVNEWTTRDDTAIGLASHAKGLAREDYVLTLAIKAIQRAPQA